MTVSVAMPVHDDAAVEAPEASVAADIARRALYVAPLFVLGGLIASGLGGAASAAIGVVLVLVNFAAAAASLTWAARISLSLLMGVALFGYLLRLSVLFLAVLVLRDLDWVHVPSLGLTLAIMHLGLLLWELKYVSLSLARPGLKPEAPHTRSPST